MSCCATPLPADAETVAAASREEMRLASRYLGDGLLQTDLAAPGVHCAACIHAIESGLAKLAGVAHVRVNLSTRRVAVKWRGEAPPDLLGAMAHLGYPAHLFEIDADVRDPEFSRLIRALAVAGFCSMNIMILSVSVWSGAEPETRAAFHWISAALALPCLLYSGQVFFASAWSALRHGRTNMDVPISIGITLAFGLSLYDTVHDGPHAYFEAATSLIFFLLIGRTLEHVMRERARAAVRGLMRLAPRGATVLRADGGRDYLPVNEIEPGMRIALTAGERVPVDGVVEDGVSELDCAIVTGESAPRRVELGAAVQAGTLNLSGALVIIASARADSSFLAEMVRLMEAAEGGRARYRRIADRAATLYSPVVHATACLTFLGWMALVGEWHQAITVAIAVLIITCPCALGLAVPIVQVVASRRLFENGIMVKDGSAIERMAEIDAVAFDKTGTLTLGQPRLVNGKDVAPDMLAIAAEVARRSNHPLSRAIADAVPAGDLVLSEVSEYPGLGIEARLLDRLFRLGRAEWALSIEIAPTQTAESGTVLSCDGDFLARFAFEEAMRPQARPAVGALHAAGLDVSLLSGDAPDAVQAMARKLGIDSVAASLLPAQKVERLAALTAEGRKVLMVGDGLNDVPALAAAHVSMAPASAADLSRNAADFVFLREGLDAVPMAIAVSRHAGRLVRQNFALAITYNAIALPIAIAGHVTPLIAALAMSLSSILVVANALRLDAGRRSRPRDAQPDLIALAPTLRAGG
ncbi:Cu2+-exporting ATPase [Bosea sp. CRIB-10]|uniref:cation-translocating P-type ATPase n=1 Tax=Bosea sp. CRIB-10 TaxID=378404 RepID=UPI0008ECAD18|nr:cation-translocating P-type ATPase [Bosea sp. CRIB-10]SFC84895.1 Cu2+-exporting ATPase [Bosea sp. CRIB-10]